MSEWLSSLKDQAIPSLAERIGLRRARLNSYGPCPLCNAEKRSASDPRGPLGLTANQRGSHCHACDEQIDVVDLVALCLQSKRVKDFSGSDWAAFRSACESRGLVGPEAGGSTRGRGKSNVKHVGAAADEMLGRPKAGPPERRIRSIDSTKLKDQQEPAGQDEQKGGFPWEAGAYASTAVALWRPEGAHVLYYLRSRGFSDETIREWKLGAHFVVDNERVVEEYVVIPLRDQHGRVVNCRFRSVPGPCLYCTPAGEAKGPGCSRCATKASPGGTGEVQKKYRPCTGRPLPLFGSHLLSPDRSLPVIILEGELDVIAAWEYGLRDNVVTGTAGAGTFKDEWADLVEPYDAFVLGHDSDEAGDKGAEKVATQLGRYRCSRMILPEKDLGACLEAKIPGDRIERAMEIAKSMVGVSLERPDHYGQTLEDLIEAPHRLRGVPTPSPKLTEKLGGFRPGLTVVTGDSGAGKTTWATWIGWSLAKAGVGVMITSYEQRPIGTVQKLIRMQLGNDFTKVSREERAAALAALGTVPLWVLDHYGHMGFQDVLDSIRYARRRHGVRWFLVDHLGFLVPDDEDDERRAIEKVIRALALLANTDDLMIWLICHPSNSYVMERRRVMLKDLKGASAIRQDVSDGIVIERGSVKKTTPWCHAIVHLDKVRSEFGQGGQSVTMPFDPIALHYADSPSSLPTYKGGGVSEDAEGVPV